MGLQKWLKANQQDERERYYYSRAGAVAYVVMLVACTIQGLIWMSQSQQDEAQALFAIMGLGGAVWAGLILRWKVTR